MLHIVLLKVWHPASPTLLSPLQLWQWWRSSAHYSHDRHVLCALLSLLAACNRLSPAMAVFREVEEDERREREGLHASSQEDREGEGEAPRPADRGNGWSTEAPLPLPVSLPRSGACPWPSAGRAGQSSGRWVRQGGAGSDGGVSESGYQPPLPQRSCIDAAVYNALIVASGRAGRHRLALRLFDEMCHKAGVEGLGLGDGDEGSMGEERGEGRGGGHV